MISIAKPFIGQEECDAVVDVLKSGGLAQGKRVAAFEERFGALHGTRHAVAVNNGTTALIAALLAHGIGPGDEVVVPPFTFFATASAVFAVGARPVFADIDERTFNLSVAATEQALTPRTRAVIPVHMYGQPADMPAFAELCERRGLILLEDAAQAHLASIDGRPVGSWGTAAFSFYPTKNMTTTEGGMLLTNDDGVAERLRMLRNQGMSAQYLHELMGYNFRMTDVAAAIGIAQLERLQAWTEIRRANAALYDARLSRVITPWVAPGNAHVYHQYTVRVRPGTDRDQVVEKLGQLGIGVRVYYPLPIHQQPAVKRAGGYDQVSYPVAERACREVFSLPVHPFLSREDLERVIEGVESVC
ncbi:MAG TPA: DegT/DnrJ/EryC1/StrS family aminotransferase [Polyangiaceae bacterium]|nr:DegT/DnrJ/EryC1/StrS family aminotransferase [Polyangiaceae bacterium]